VSVGASVPVRARSGGVALAIAMAIIAFMIVLLGLSPTLNPIDVLLGKGFEVKTPDTVGLDQTKALLLLEQGSLNGRVAFDYSNDVDLGLVIRQTPAPKDRVLRGDSVSVVVSRGPSKVPMLDVLAVAKEDAVQRLKGVGIETKVDERNDEAVPAGLVISQVPSAGQIITGGSQVSVVVSLGPVTRTVPDVSKLPKEGALFNIGKAGFALGIVSYLDDPKLPANAVISTNPPAGEARPRDTPIDVVVSSGPTPVQAPSVIGQTFEAAAVSLLNQGLIAAQTTTPAAPGEPLNIVVSQDPAPGAPIRPGQLVTLTVRR